MTAHPLLRVLRTIAVCLLLFPMGCGRSVDIETTIANGELAFTVKRHNVPSLYMFRIWDNSSGAFIWILQNPFEPSALEKILYGIVPKGTRQLYPRNDETPSPLREGQQIAISVSYGYDKLMAPSIGYETRLYTVMADGSLKPVHEGSINYPSVDFPH